MSHHRTSSIVHRPSAIAGSVSRPATSRSESTAHVHHHRRPGEPLTFGTPKTLLPQPCVLVIFGAAGDLSWRKLLPAIYNLNVDGLLPSNFAVVGFGVGSKGDPDEWIRQRARDGIEHFSRQPLDEGHWADFSRGLFYVEGKFDDRSAYDRLKTKLGEVDQQFGIPGSRIYYLSIPPQLVADQRRDAQGRRAWSTRPTRSGPSPA